MNEFHQLKVTTRDRLLRGWENSTELVRDFQSYSREIKDNSQASALFARMAEDEAVHAARLLDMLHQYDG